MATLRTGKSGVRGHARHEASLLHSVRRWLRTVETHRITLGLLTSLVLTAVTVLHLVPDKVSLRLGEVSPKEVRAPRAARYNDSAATERLRQQLLSTVSPEFEVDPYATPGAEAAVSQVFARLDGFRGQMGILAMRERLRRLRHEVVGELGITLSEGATRAIVDADGQTLQALSLSTRDLLLQVMKRPGGIRDGTTDIQEAMEEITTLSTRLTARPELREVSRAVAHYALRPTLFYSREKTEQARRRVEALVKPVDGEVLPGEPIIHKGETVTQTHLDKFIALGLRHPRPDWLVGFYLAVYLTGMVALVGAYLFRYHRPIYEDKRHLWLLSLIVITTLLAFKLGGSALGIKLDSNQYGYFGMLGLSTASMLIAVLLDPWLAVVVAALLSVHVGIMTNHDLRFSAVALICSLVGIHGFSRIRDRRDLVRTLLVLCLASMLAIWVLGSISGDSMQDLLTGVAWGIGSSVFACLITWLGVALLERPFGITTHIGLLELSDMNQPALRRLLQEAPGTYIHSLNVGQLAEAAAEAIGADTLLARVGAYYHDIGKVMRPYCFIENQTVENIHNRLNPTLSTLVVTSHIKDGVDLAREYRLPPVIMDIIRSHHGNGLVKYFYHQAKLASDGENPVPEHHFRYDGPRPHSKEAGIIMLADSVEGAVRSALGDRPDPSRIQSIVTRIIKDKASDGQLDECALTFQDLSKIGVAFTRILQSLFHARIKYPDALTAEGQRLHASSSDSTAEHPASTPDAGGGGDDRQQIAAP